MTSTERNNYVILANHIIKWLLIIQWSPFFVPCIFKWYSSDFVEKNSSIMKRKIYIFLFPNSIRYLGLVKWEYKAFQINWIPMAYGYLDENVIYRMSFFYSIFSHLYKKYNDKKVNLFNFSENFFCTYLMAGVSWLFLYVLWK